jgi:hypothetical protein
MKKNLNHIAFVITLTLAYNMQTIAMSCYISKQQEQIRKFQDDETRRAEEEIEDLLMNSPLSIPHYEEPGFWKVQFTKYGIKFLYAFFNLKTQIVNAVSHLRGAISEENAANNEKILQ